MKLLQKTQRCLTISAYPRTLSETHTHKVKQAHMQYAHSDTHTVIFKGTQGQNSGRDNSSNELAWVGDPGAWREEWCRHGDTEAKGLSHGVMQVFLEGD